MNTTLRIHEVSCVPVVFDLPSRGKERIPVGTVFIALDFKQLVQGNVQHAFLVEGRLMFRCWAAAENHGFFREL